MLTLQWNRRSLVLMHPQSNCTGGVSKLVWMVVHQVLTHTLTSALIVCSVELVALQPTSATAVSKPPIISAWIVLNLRNIKPVHAVDSVAPRRSLARIDWLPPHPQLSSRYAQMKCV